MMMLIVLLIIIIIIIIIKPDKNLRLSILFQKPKESNRVISRTPRGSSRNSPTCGIPRVFDREVYSLYAGHFRHGAGPYSCLKKRRH